MTAAAKKAAGSRAARKGTAGPETPEHSADARGKKEIEAHVARPPDQVAMVSRRADGEPDQTPGFEVIAPDSPGDVMNEKGKRQAVSKDADRGFDEGVEGNYAADHPGENADGTTKNDS